MILFTHFLSATLVVGLGLMFLWRSGIDIRALRDENIKERRS